MNVYRSGTGAGQTLIFTPLVTAVCCVKWHHGHHLEIMTLFQKSDSVNWWHWMNLNCWKFRFYRNFALVSICLKII